MAYWVQQMKIQIDSISDQAILTALREGKHRRAARILVRYYGSAVFHLCSSVVKDIEHAEDMTQASFQRAFSSLSSLQGQASTLDWLRAIALSCCEAHLEEQGCTPRPAADGIADDGAAADAPRSISASLQRRLEVLASCL